MNPTGRLSFAGWYAYLVSPEELHPLERVHRYGASAMYAGNGLSGGTWASSLIWGANESAGRVENSALAETNLEIGQKNAVFGRVEYVRKNGEELALSGVNPLQQFDIGSVLAGYVREIAKVRGASIGIGGLVSVGFVPSTLEPFYGTRAPAGLDLYIRIRPTRMSMDSTAGMGGMKMDESMPGMRMPQ